MILEFVYQYVIHTSFYMKQKKTYKLGVYERLKLIQKQFLFPTSCAIFYQLRLFYSIFKGLACR